jgi:hypothetical protein
MSAYRKFVDTLGAGSGAGASPKPPQASNFSSTENSEVENLGGLGALDDAGREIGKADAEPQSAELVAPLSWFARIAPLQDGEPSFEKPCDGRRGRMVENSSGLLHFCVTCGCWGAFGYGVALRAGRLGHWYCAEHRPR